MYSPRYNLKTLFFFDEKRYYRQKMMTKKHLNEEQSGCEKRRLLDVESDIQILVINEILPFRHFVP